MPLNHSLERHQSLTAAALLALLAIVAFWPALSNDFVPLDDVIYILKNPPVLKGLTLDSPAWAFGTFYGGNWHPLTWLSHMLDVSLFGLDPMGHHLMGVLVHAANAVLLLFALRALSGALWRSFAVAALFAVHPLHVESVAWVSERKDVLCTLFWFCALWAYAVYARAPSLRRYLLVAMLFALGLMAKSMIVTLPLLLLLLDFWPLARLRPGAEWSWSAARRLLLEKLPMLAMSLGIGVATMLAQRQYGALNTWDVLPLDMRIYNALRAYVSYLGKTLWPESLAILYPFPGQIVLWQGAAYAGALLLLSACSLLLARRAPYLLTGWFWYLGTLAPVIGIVQVGIQSMADRYTYVPLVGVFIILVWGAHDLFSSSRKGRLALVFGLVVVLAVLTPLTWMQTKVWRNGEALLSHALKVIPGHHEARYNLGGVLFTKGDYAGAARHLEPYVRTHPHNAKAVEMLVQSLVRLDRPAKLLPYLKLALRHRPGDAQLLAMRGYAHYKLGAYEQAAASLQRSLKARPEDARSSVLLGLSLLQMGRLKEAQPLLEKGLLHSKDTSLQTSLQQLVREEVHKLVLFLEANGLEDSADQVRHLQERLPL